MLKGKNFLKLIDLTTEEIQYLLDLSLKLKTDKKEGKEVQQLVGKNIGLIFEKDSTRTRCAFEVATFDQGAHCTYLGPSGSQMGKKETIRDTARVLGRYYDGIEFRGFKQTSVELLGEHSGRPVWNGLTDKWHPTQILATLLTFMEHTTKPLKDVKFAFVGDTRFNMCNSLMIGAMKMGMDFRAIGPANLQPPKDVLEKAKEIQKETGAKLLITDDIEKGVKGVDFIYTDTWVSMGEPEHVWKSRIELLKPYQVNKKMMELSGNKDVKFTHCLPSFHNNETTIGADIEKKFGVPEMEVTDEIFESDASIVFDEAENRMHTIKAVMVATLNPYN